MGRRPLVLAQRWPLFVVLAATAGLALGACGSTERTTTVKTVTVTNTVSPTPKRAAAKSARVRPRHRRARPARAPSTFRACDQNITAQRGTTSCEFAQNVFWSHWHARQSGESTFTAYSPVTGRDYDVSCVSRSLVICRAGDGAQVRFPLSAVLAYSAEQAARYAEGHDTGEPPSVPEDSGGGNEAEEACDPNYSGECLDPNSVDYDCEGGSGNGPDYTGPVRVIGEDHFDLDRDNNGEACE